MTNNTRPPYTGKWSGNDCIDCGALPGESCLWTGTPTTRYPEPAGTPRKPHENRKYISKERVIDCVNPNHDHELLANDEPGKCNDCGWSAHYDEGTGEYHHDDPGWYCFLTSPHTTNGHTPCEEKKP